MSTPSNNNKKPMVKPPLTLVEIITRADAATIQAALEARQKIDALLAERAAAYERIAALEKQVDEVMGEPGLFVFPAPAVAVAPFVAAPVVAAVEKPVEPPKPAEPAKAPEAPAHPAEAASKKPAGKNN